MARKFQNERFTFHQPDGTKFEVRGSGNQHHAVFERNGHAIVQCPRTLEWHYAKPGQDNQSLVSTGRRCELAPLRNQRLARGLVDSTTSIRTETAERSRMMTGTRRCDQRRREKQNLLRATARGNGPLALPPSRTTVGDYVGLCILVHFSDVTSQITEQQVRDFCNEVGYSGFGNNGSVYDYFFEVSNEKLRYTNLVVSFTAPKPKSYYTEPTVAFGSRARELIIAALTDIRDRGVDLASLTVDDQDYIYAVNVLYAGSVTNNWGEGLWPHAWSLSTPLPLGPGRAFDYQVTAIGQEPTLGTFCHENGHMICDFPDLYDYGYESHGVGDFCLMCAGGHEKNPTQVSAYLKHLAGWATRVEILEHDTKLDLEPDGGHFAVHKRNETEYFILENRQRTGRDAGLPAAGLAIWHVDETGSNNNEQGTPGLHYELALEQADGTRDMERKVNQGDARDLFPLDDAKRFADSTEPNSRWWDGQPSHLDIYDIDRADGRIKFAVRLHPDQEQELLIEREVKPNERIPDRDPKGFLSKIEVDEDVKISSVRIDVDIEHTWRGDLLVTLYPPNSPAHASQGIVLHNRTGSDADDLRTSFDATTVPALTALTDSPSAGEWALHVQDLAQQDEGTLRAWGLSIRGVATSGSRHEQTPNEPIPDDDLDGIQSTIDVPDAGKVRTLEVSVDIEHAHVNDLAIFLEAPDGTKVALQRTRKEEKKDLVRTFTMSDTPDLEDFFQTDRAGRWTLHVRDQVGEDVGTLRSWSLETTGG